MKITEKDKERFFAKVKINEETGCHEWIGAKDRRGYGQLRKNKKNIAAHRLAYYIANGEYDESLCVCHHCDNPSCVNPEHLFLGTMSDNTQDMIKKGRGVNPPLHCGEEAWCSILCEKEVINIRKSLLTNNELAIMYGVSYATIWDIKNERSWKHLIGENT